jgi:hypothetical protein
MNEFVDLELRRNRGWPWPEDSWGLTPMYGDDGWCRSCGVPRRPQSGSLILQGRSFGSVRGAWVPNWRFDAYCLESSLAESAAAAGFRLPLLPVEWHGESLEDAVQIVAPTVGEAWFDAEELQERTIAKHGAAGARCDECGVWRWYPLLSQEMPPYRHGPMEDDVHVAASPEWFGDGHKAFRQIIVRRELAEMIAAASSPDFQLREIQLEKRGGPRPV